MSREEEIRIIAYRIWEEEGCKDGHNLDHWFRAEMIWKRQSENGESHLEHEEAREPSMEDQQARSESDGCVLRNQEKAPSHRKPLSGKKPLKKSNINSK